MLKKTTESTQNIPCWKKNCIHCSICSCNLSKTILHMCESGHIECKTCPHSDASEGRQDNGDFISGKKRTKHTRKTKSSRSIDAAACAQIKDLASGDHDKSNKIKNTKHKSKSQIPDKAIEVIPLHGDTKSRDKKNTPNKEVETVLEYKNTNYRESSSSSASACSKHESEYIGELAENRICPRPVTCPVQKCSKMLALDSVMLHFYFDHSKVPRMTLTTATPRQLALKPYSLSMETQCLAVFTLQDTNELSLVQKLDTGTHNDCKSILLMGARIQIEKPKIDKSHISRKKTNSSTVVNQNKTNSLLAVNIFESTEILMLWLCKLDDSTQCYNITILKENKNQGHTYTGEANHIREGQSAISMYQKAECLMVHGAAVNRLLNKQNYISTRVSIIV